LACDRGGGPDDGPSGHRHADGDGASHRSGRDRANPLAEAHIAGLLALPRADGSRISAAAVPDVTPALPGADFAQVIPAIDVATAL
jgi:hypothetical protein